MRYPVPCAVIVFTAFFVTTSASLGQLTANYELDSSGFFDTYPAAKLAAEAALADLNNALNQNLAAIDGVDVQETYNTASVTFGFTARVRNPSTDMQQDISGVRNLGEVPIYLGATPFGDNTLGVGGPGGFSLSGGIRYSNPDDIGPAVTAAALKASQIYSRGEGPTIGMLNGSFNDTYPYLVGYGLGHGSISFDNDSNNNNINDLQEDIDLSEHFHFDHTIPVAFGKSDFYSLTLHEALHAVGMGASYSWSMLANGTHWTGTEVTNYLGYGDNVIHPDGGHVADNILSPRITDGEMQESVLITTLTAGERIQLTELDLAFLRDLGYTNAVVPPRGLPGDFDGDGDVDVDDINFYSGNLDQSADNYPELDLNQDGKISLADHDMHVTTYVQTSNGQTGALIGDLNLDGTVNVLGDGFALIGSLGATGVTTYARGDVNADQKVDVLGDGFRLIENLGQSNDPGSSIRALVVPEPAGVQALILLASIAAFRRARQSA